MECSISNCLNSCSNCNISCSRTKLECIITNCFYTVSNWNFCCTAIIIERISSNCSVSSSSARNSNWCNICTTVECILTNSSCSAWKCNCTCNCCDIIECIISNNKCRVITFKWNSLNFWSCSTWIEQICRNVCYTRTNWKCDSTSCTTSTCKHSVISCFVSNRNSIIIDICKSCHSVKCIISNTIYTRTNCEVCYKVISCKCISINCLNSICNNNLCYVSVHYHFIKWIQMVISFVGNDFVPSSFSLRIHYVLSNTDNILATVNFVVPSVWNVKHIASSNSHCFIFSSKQVTDTNQDVTTFWWVVSKYQIFVVFNNFIFPLSLKQPFVARSDVSI